MERDRIKEILEIRGRVESNYRHNFLTYLSNLGILIDKFSDLDEGPKQEALKYIPISIVACYEAFFRAAIKELIDFGKPFSENAKKLDNRKFELEIVLAISKKTLTVGDFIAHLLSTNNVNDIDKNLSKVIGTKFLDNLKNFKKESKSEYVEKVQKYYRENSDKIIKDVKRTFELRHIFCHEFATNITLNKQEVSRLFSSCQCFLHQSEQYINNLLYPDIGETTSEMNQKAFSNFEEKEEELSKLILRIKNTKQEPFFEIDFDLFDKMIENWKEYRELRTLLANKNFEKDSMFSGLCANTKRTITIEKIESLKNDYNYLLKKNQNT